MISILICLSLNQFYQKKIKNRSFSRGPRRTGYGEKLGFDCFIWYNFIDVFIDSIYSSIIQRILLFCLKSHQIILFVFFHWNIEWWFGENKEKWCDFIKKKKLFIFCDFIYYNLYNKNCSSSLFFSSLFFWKVLESWNLIFLKLVESGEDHDQMPSLETHFFNLCASWIKMKIDWLLFLLILWLEDGLRGSGGGGWLW